MNDTIFNIWVIDDERIIRMTLADDLRDVGHVVREFTDARATLKALQESMPDIVITDLKMPDMNGIELLTKIKDTHPEVIVVVMTAYGTVENAVKAMKIGAFDYITKPFLTEEMLLIVKRIGEFNSILNENIRLKKQIHSKFDFCSYVGDSEANKELFNLIKLVAVKDSTVLITGETGTGKELIANIIHFNSSRKNQLMVKVSCAILSREIFESELFGHVKGAFTGADNDKKGRFELANNGTLYLDDVDDIPYELQVKLLRALEQGEIERVGSTKTFKINVRVIASTKKNLRKLVNNGKFREDLFYRLNIFPLNLMPLRERKKDIKKILEFYYRKFTTMKELKITNEAYKELYAYHWPGNVRELKNIAERLSILAGDEEIQLSNIPLEIRQKEYVDICNSVGNKSLNKILSETEISSIKCALEKTKNNKSKAALILGVPPSTLRTKMDKYGMD
jgi:DNA-binding NtrC family response regulator